MRERPREEGHLVAIRKIATLLEPEQAAAPGAPMSSDSRSRMTGEKFLQVVAEVWLDWQREAHQRQQDLRPR